MHEVYDPVVIADIEALAVQVDFEYDAKRYVEYFCGQHQTHKPESEPVVIGCDTKAQAANLTAYCLARNFANVHMLCHFVKWIAADGRPRISIHRWGVKFTLPQQYHKAHPAVA